MSTRSAWGIGLATVTAAGNTLDVWYPFPKLGAPSKDAAGPYGVPADLAALASADPARGTNQQVVHTSIDLDTPPADAAEDRKSTRLNSSHVAISYAVFCLKKKNKEQRTKRQNTRKRDSK